MGDLRGRLSVNLLLPPPPPSHPCFTLQRCGKMHTSYTPPTPTRNWIGIARIARTHVLGIQMLSVMLVCTTTHGGAYSTDNTGSVPGQARSVKVSYGRCIVDCLHHSNLTILALFCLVTMAVVVSSCFLCDAEVATFSDTHSHTPDFFVYPSFSSRRIGKGEETVRGKQRNLFLVRDWIRGEKGI